MGNPGCCEFSWNSGREFSAFFGNCFYYFQGIFWRGAGFGGNFLGGIFTAGAQPKPWKWQAWKTNGNLSKKPSQIPKFPDLNSPLGINPTRPTLPKQLSPEYPPLIPEKLLGKSQILHPKSQEFQETPGIPWKFQKICIFLPRGRQKPGKSLGNVQIPWEKSLWK